MGIVILKHLTLKRVIRKGKEKVKHTNCRGLFTGNVVVKLVRKAKLLKDGEVDDTSTKWDIELYECERCGWQWLNKQDMLRDCEP